MAFMQIFLCKRSNKHISKFKNFSGTLSPASMSEGVTEVNGKSISYHFTRILFIKSSHLYSRADLGKTN